MGSSWSGVIRLGRKGSAVGGDGVCSLGGGVVTLGDGVFTLCFRMRVDVLFSRVLPVMV